ncbi:MAG: ATP synthase F0 subunit B [Proteobacteria bacterium]|jgi:F0F1-type ATP synthase membrane subunit b/b'|nr:ATP synthase F0 subunit B [Pseudomonadota bacterium]
MLIYTAYFFCAIAALSAEAFAAGNGGHGSVSDLLAPLVNVLLLGGFLAWKLKKPLSDYFTKQADEISNTLERASLKSKEAEVMLQAQMKKMANVDSEAKEIVKQAQVDVKTFEKNYTREMEEKAGKMKIDATAKIEAERKLLINQLNGQLLDQVIAKAKSSIKSNKAHQSQISGKMLGEMLK